MWKTAIALLLPCSCAMAQSSVTLYGIVDAGLNYVSNAQTAHTSAGLKGGSQWAMMEGAAGGIQGSRWGLKGVEELGGGYRAVFLLENGFFVNNGTAAQGGALFGRQAWVGLATPYGRVTLGRQYDEVVDFYAPLLAAPQWGGYMVEHPGDLDNASNTRRANNSIKYTSPTLSGFKFGALYSFGGTPGAFGNNSIWSAGMGYAYGPLNLGAGYLRARNPNTSFFGNNPNSGAATTNNLGSAGSATSAESGPIFAGFASAQSLQIIGVAGSWAFGKANVGLGYSNTQFQNLGSLSGPNPFRYSGTATFHNIEVNGRYSFTPSLSGGIAFDYTVGGGTHQKSNAKYELTSLGLDYALSARTDVYSLLVYEHASGTDSLNQPAVATITGMTPSATSSQVAVRIGVRHKF
ncbi:porin [Burkholderia sp. Ac-20379]|uniref:porin n=1 Tax=Burkholderia sp. Ac-20379 TaxID=2703900 RepID=UPI0019818A2F|nr:porin [Burkholderia sp. Ac-20379]MBN3724536.1 porin [Burkholderia sp. Ac-20379]